MQKKRQSDLKNETKVSTSYKYRFPALTLSGITEYKTGYG